MARGILLLTTLAVVSFSLAAGATSIGAITGIDPTGIVLVGAVADVQINSLLDARMQLSLSVNSDIKGLLLVGGAVVARYPISIFVPFLGVGGGMAATPRGYSWGMTLDGIVGVRIVLAGPIAAFVDLHYITRFSAATITAGPLYEVGISLSL